MEWTTAPMPTTTATAMGQIPSSGSVSSQTYLRPCQRSCPNPRVWPWLSPPASRWLGMRSVEHTLEPCIGRSDERLIFALGVNHAPPSSSALAQITGRRLTECTDPRRSTRRSRRVCGKSRQQRAQSGVVQPSDRCRASTRITFAHLIKPTAT